MDGWAVCEGGECCCSKLILISASSQSLPACRGFMIKMTSVMTSLICAAIKCTKNLNITDWLPFSPLLRARSVSCVYSLPPVNLFSPFSLAYTLSLSPSHLPLSMFFDLPSPPLPFCWSSLLNFNWANLAIGAWCHREELLTGKKRVHLTLQICVCSNNMFN